MSIPQFSTIISTLVANGFHIRRVDRFADSNSIITTYKYDKLGAVVNYGLLFTDDDGDTPIITTLLKLSKTEAFTPLVVGDFIKTSQAKTYTNEQFFNFFGGIVNTGLILVPNLSALLYQLGHNVLPESLNGVPDDLHEIYIKESFQFLMESPTRRYGADRRFEPLVDGLVLSKARFMLPLESKAYSNGYSFQADDIKRFASYVNDNNERYSTYFGRVFTFVVITGHFLDSEESIQGRSDELYNLCNSKLCCIESNVLGEIVDLVKNHPVERSSIVWKNILTNLKIKTKHVQNEITRIQKDKLHL